MKTSPQSTNFHLRNPYEENFTERGKLTSSIDEEDNKGEGTSESLAPSEKSLSSKTRRIQSIFGGSKGLSICHASRLMEYFKRLVDQESSISSDSKQSRMSGGWVLSSNNRLVQSIENQILLT